MSVAGDIIDELKISPKLIYGAATGICSALGLGLFVLVAIAMQPSETVLAPSKADNLSYTSPSSMNEGGTPRPR